MTRPIALRSEGEQVAYLEGLRAGVLLLASELESLDVPDGILRAGAIVMAVTEAVQTS